VGALASCLGAPATTLEVLTTGLGMPATSLEALQITLKQSGNDDIFFGNRTGVPGNHSYYLSFNEF